MTYRQALLGASVLLIASPAFAGPVQPTYVPDLLPPNPVAGECYGRVEIPAQYETTTSQVVTRDAHQRLLVRQAQLDHSNTRVLVKEPSVRYEVRQPTFGTVSQQVMTRPGFDRLTVTSPEFQTVTETVQKGQARLVWKRGNPNRLRAEGYIIHSTAAQGDGGLNYGSNDQHNRARAQICGDSCEVWCLVEEPGESVTVTRQALVSAGQVQRTPVAPQFQTITKQVVTDPGGVKKVPVPGEYRNLSVETLVRPGATATVNVPAEYGQAPGRRLVSEGRYEWRRIACEPGVQGYTPPAPTYRPTPSHGLSGGHVQASGHAQQSSIYTQSNRVGSHHAGSVQGSVRPYTGTTIGTTIGTTMGTTSANTGAYSGTVSGSNGTVTGTSTGYYSPHQPVVTHAPLQGALTQPAPAYSAPYQSPQTAYPYAQGQTYTQSPQTTASSLSSGSPDRNYSGPAYVDPALIDYRSGKIHAVDPRSGPVRTRR